MEKYCYGTYKELLRGDTEQTAYLDDGMSGVATDENGLYYMRARYYNTDIKRFINRDVVKVSINNSHSLNRYSYVQGNPVSLTDPFGLSPFSWSALGHGVFTALGLIPYIGKVFDLINAAWYTKEGRYDMAVLCTIAAVPLCGSVAGGTFTMFKCAKYVQAVTKVVSNAATLMPATGGNGTVVEVNNYAETDTLLKKEFPDYQKVNGIGRKEAEEIRKKNKMNRYKQGGAYHKDYAIGHKTGRVYSHTDNTPHGMYPHINIKRKDGKTVIINILRGEN